MFCILVIGGSLPQGCGPVWYACFFTGHTFSDARMDHFWESPGEKEKTQDECCDT